MGWTEELPSGKYRAVYRDNTGKRRSAGTYTQKREAAKQATLAEDAARKLGWRDPAAALQTWGEWCSTWWNTRGVEPGTLARDASRRDVHLMPKWSGVPLSQITRQGVKAWASELRASGLAVATVQRCVHLLSASLNAAVDDEILTINPAARIRLARGDTVKDRYLTQPEFAALVTQFPTALHQAIASTLVGTGIRWGELAGLQIKRVDLRRGTLRVAETWDDKMRRVKEYPKGRRVRDVPIPAWVVDHLDGVIGDRTTGFVFELEGKPVDYHNWRSRRWAVALKASEIEPATIHDLRHTYASWLIQAGVSIEEVGRLLGHISPITTRRYAHLADSPSDHIRAALPDPSRGADVGQPTASLDYATLLQFPRRTSE